MGASIGALRLCATRPMGQEQPDGGLVAALRVRGAATKVTVASVRSPVDVGRRIPVDQLARLPWSTQIAAGPERRELGLPERSVMRTGSATTRKNLSALAAAWVLSRSPNLNLVMCGPEDPRRSELFSGLPNTLLLGRVPRERLRWLMASASAVVVPSTCEGFDIPVLEAIATGAPLVVSDRAAVAEVAGSRAILVEPNGADFADGIQTALSGVDPGVRDVARATAAKRTRAAAADAYAVIYRRVCEQC